jgi:hypothetical protein
MSAVFKHTDNMQYMTTYTDMSLMIEHTVKITHKVLHMKYL